MEPYQGLPESSWMESNIHSESPIEGFNDIARYIATGSQPEQNEPTIDPQHLMAPPPTHSSNPVIPFPAHTDLSKTSSEHIQPQQPMLPHEPGYNSNQRMIVNLEPETSQTQGHYGIPLHTSGHKQDGQSAGKGSDFSAWKVYLTCPYFAKDPILHLSCIIHKLDDYSRLKQHLRAKHAGFTDESYKVPTCACCGTPFPGQKSIPEHKCIPKRSDNKLKVSRQAWSALKGRSENGKPDTKKWDEMWEVLFHEPAEQRPDPKFEIKDTVMNKFIDFIKILVQREGEGFGAVLQVLKEMSPNDETAPDVFKTFIKLLDVLKVSIGAVANERISGTAG